LSRNNEDRLTPTTGATQDAATETPPTTATGATEQTGNNPFNFVTPTEIVDLPSGGEFYPEGHTLHGIDEIEIRHMTAKDEDILTSRTLLKKGLALDRMVSNLIVDKRINADSMLIGDKNAIIVAARRTGYGAEYTTKVNCPSCGETNTTTFDLDEVGTSNLQAYTMLDHVNRTATGFDIELPRSNVTVGVKLLTGEDEQIQQKILRKARTANKSVKTELTLTSQFKAFITAVNGDANPLNVGYFIDHMPASDSRLLRNTYKAITPNVDMNQYFNCNVCDFETEMEVPFTADFFWPE
jgi:hypothetical protein